MTGLVITYLSFSAGIGQYGLGLAFLAGAFVYLYLRMSHQINGLDTEMSDSNGKSTHKTVLKLTNAIFLICFAISIYILHQAIYIRPPIYFVLVTVAYLSIFLELFHINKEGPACYLNILKTILLSLSFRAGLYFSFPTIPGADTQFHLGFANLIAETGHVPGYESFPSQYVYTTLWHVLVASTDILLDVDTSKLLFLSIVLPFVILTSLFLFLIVKKIANVQTGLIALLFVNIADMFFVRGLTNINASALVLCLFIIILFCLIQEKNKTIFSACVLLMMFCTVFTHQLSTFCVFIVFSVLLVSKPLYDFLSSQFAPCDNQVKKLSWNLNSAMFTYFLVLLLFHWSMMGMGGETTFFGGMAGRLKGTLSRMFSEYTDVTDAADAAACTYVTTFATFDNWSNLLYNLGYSILMGLAVVGVLIWLNRRYISLTRFSYIVAAGCLFAIIYPGTYIGLDLMFIPHRFISFLEVFLVVFAAYSVYNLYRISVQSKGRIVVCFVVAALIFFMVTTPYVNRNDTIYCQEREYRSEFTNSEVASDVWAISHPGNEIIYIDSLFKQGKISTVTPLNLSVKSMRYYPTNTENLEGLVIVRPFFEERGGTVFVAGTFGKLRAHNSSQFLSTVTKDYNLVFSSGGTRIYQHTTTTSNTIPKSAGNDNLI
ncbi:hypothetical protein C5S35_17580 [Candidatus Methanophagaceae archaeon]|nr:hypothetical protein C5S35_17580 [Methanophagales archaeon]